MNELEIEARRVAKLINGKVYEAKSNASEDIFATISTNGNDKYALLDGGSEPVPVTSAVAVTHGDRVIVHIVDHKAVVVSNISKPTTSDEYAINAVGNLVRQVNEIRADTGRFGELFANTADVYVLVAEDATVGQLEAANAKIAELQAQNLTVEKVTATQATIDLLNADSIEATTVAADGATVKVLSATSAAITSLEANVATIHELRSAVASIQQLDVESLTAMYALISELDVAGLEAAAADVQQLKADTAFVNALTGKTIGADELTAVNATIDTLNAHGLNADAAALAAASIKSLLAQSGWFEEVTVTGDATITGQLKSVLIDGDTARFQNIYANALKLLGKDGLYHALNFQGLDEAQHAVYTAVTPEGTEDPSEEGWFVFVIDSYKLTEDEEVDSEKTYYSATTTYSYALTEDESIDPEKTYYEPTYSYAQTQDVSVDSEKTYYTPNYSYALTEDESLDSGKTYYEPTYVYAPTEDESLDEDKTYYTPTYSYALTQDESLDSGKTYYVLDNDAYTVVSEPDVADIATYYERSVSGYTAVSEPDVSDIAGYYERSVSGYSAVQSPDVSDIAGYYERSVSSYTEVSSPDVSDIATYYEYVVSGYSAVAEPDASDIAGYYERSSTTTYSAVTPVGTEDPSEEGWYVPDETHYAESEDATVSSGVTYYSESHEYSNAVTKALFDSYGESLDGGLHGSHIIAETVTAEQIDATSVRAALLEVLNLVVGLRDGFHIEIEADTGGGSMNFVYGEKPVPDQPWSYEKAPGEEGVDNQGNRIAYLQADSSGDSLFYMNKAVVVKDLRFARWQWKARGNGNLTLKWVG